MDESLGIHGSHQDEKVFVKPIDILKACEMLYACRNGSPNGFYFRQVWIQIVQHYNLKKPQQFGFLYS